MLAALRDRTFLGVADANAAIAERVAWPDARPLRKLPGSRLSLFEELDRPALRPLPAARYEYATWRTARASIDYHVEVDRHWYSVPYQLVGQACDIRSVPAGADLANRPWGVRSGSPLATCTAAKASESRVIDTPLGQCGGRDGSW